MADINVSHPPYAKPTEPAPAAPEAAAPRSQIDLIELLFFAYRNFVSDPDEVLQGIGFGRAHHRVLHFVNRHPGMRVTDLLDILRITKQSLGRVLRELVDEGFVDSRAGAADRRQRLLYLTPKGAALARDFVALQSQRIENALAACSPGGREDVRRFLVAMIDADDQAGVEKLITRADQSADLARPEKAPARPRAARQEAGQGRHQEPREE